MPSHPSWQLLKHRQSAVVLQVLVEADAKPALSQDAIDRAVPLGLILNEIATNSIKHAFGPEGGGRITVKPVAGVGYGEARLSVADNGRGVKKDNPKGTGLKLVAALARQIGGTIDQDSSNEGTTTCLTFPVITS
jgi:two-component system, sensor histidine kinase PdtaS